MTEEELKQFWKDPNSITAGDPTTALEFMYQAFKSRLKAEAVSNIWPED